MIKKVISRLAPHTNKDIKKRYRGLPHKSLWDNPIWNLKQKGDTNK